MQQNESLQARQLATVLAALRYWQRTILATRLDAIGPESDIATNGGTLVPLTGDEIDTLCEHLNGAADELPTAVIEINGGAIYCARSSVPMRIVILDEDVEGSDGERVRVVNGEEYYVHDYVLIATKQDGQGGIDPEFVRDTVEAIEGAVVELAQPYQRQKLFLAEWGNGYQTPGHRIVRLQFFEAGNGYDLGDRAAIDMLAVDGTWSGDLGSHRVTRLPDTAQSDIETAGWFDVNVYRAKEDPDRCKGPDDTSEHILTLATAIYIANHAAFADCHQVTVTAGGHHEGHEQGEVVYRRFVR